MKVRYTATALIELDDIFLYIASESPGAAGALTARIERSIERLGAFPESAQQTDEPGVRQLTVQRSPYVVLYTIHNDEVVILHVRHGARQRPWEPRGG